MVQNTSSTSNGPGRPPSFDREVVISGAISAFWEKGFDATTLADLEEATGVDRSTIYNSFGGKNGLYRSATAAYVDLSEDVLFEPLHRGEAGTADIIDFLNRLADNLGSGTNPPGCLIVNDLAADTDNQAADRYLEYLHDGLSAALERGEAANETDPDKTVQRSRLLAAAILGVNIAHRSSANAPQAHALIDAVRLEVASWASDFGV